MAGGGRIYVEKGILGTLDLNSKLGFLISGVANSLWPFLGWLKAGGYQKVFGEEDDDSISRRI